MLCAEENLIVFTGVGISLPAFLGGSEVNPLNKRNVPPILAAQIFPPPGQQGRRLPLVFEFFHSFPFSKGEKRNFLSNADKEALLPLEREEGRDFWQLFSKG